MKRTILPLLCLLTAGPVLAEGTPGFVLIPSQGGFGGGSSTSTLVDPKGTTVKTFNVAGYNAYLLGNGHAVGQTGSGSAAAMGFGSLVEQAAGNSTALNTWTPTGGSFHHGHWVMPNGHWLGTVTTKINPKTVLASAGYTGTMTSMWDEIIQEWDPVTKTVVWQWKASEHTSGTNHPRKFNSNTMFKSQDPLHINSVVYDSTRNLVVMSSHYFNEVLVIDHSTTTAQASTSSGGKYGKGGDLLFRWGASKNYGGPGAAMSDVTHGGSVIEGGLPGAGNFALFGNSDNTVKQSRWYEIKGQESDTGWVIGSNGEFVATLVFDFYNSSYQSTGHYGYGQRLANGNTLITFTGSQKVVEVDPSKNVVNVLNGNTIRAYYYPPNHPGIVALGLGSSAVSRKLPNGADVEVSNGRILASGLSDGARVRVIDAAGRIRSESVASSDRIEIGSSGWAKGAYVLQIAQNGRTSSHSFALTR